MLLASGFAAASAPPDMDAALQSAFPEASRFERKTAFLTDAQLDRVTQLSGDEVETRLVTYFRVIRSAAAAETDAGAAFLDTHLVRAKPETLLISIESAGTIRRIDVLRFLEPVEYRPSPAWRAQFSGRPLDDELRLRRGIRTLSGATLSARAVTAAARRALALYSVLALGKER